MTSDQTASAESVPVTLARLEGKVDAALAAHGTRVDEHARRLSVVDTRLNAHSDKISDLERGTRAGASGWVVTGVVISAVVGLGSVLTILITLMRIVPDAP